MPNHVIVLPDPKKFTTKVFGSLWRTYELLDCLKCLPMYENNIVVKVDYDGALQKQVPDPVHIANKNGQYNSFFSVNGHLFMHVDTDWPIQNHEQWVKYYADHGVKGYFIACHRHSTKFIFDNCKASVFPSPNQKPSPALSRSYMEGRGHSDSLSVSKKISVFFWGNMKSRIARVASTNLIKNNIPDSVMINSPDKEWSPKKYLKAFTQTKIAWCPRSSWSEPESDANAPVCREWEAMCLGVMVLKHPIGTIEVEERIPGVHFVEIKNNDEDLIEKIQYYLEHEDERKEIARNGRLYFERNGTTTARAYKLLNNCLSTLNMV